MAKLSNIGPHIGGQVNKSHFSPAQLKQPVSQENNAIFGFQMLGPPEKPFKTSDYNICYTRLYIGLE